MRPMRSHEEFARDLSPPPANDLPPDPHKRNKTLHTANRICHDWMVVQGTCHYARDRGSFTNYRPVSLRLKNNIFNPHEELHVEGVRTVQLTVCRTREDPSSPQLLVLEDVLHIPEAVCNGFNPLLYGTSMSCTADFWEGAHRNGQPLWGESTKTKKTRNQSSRPVAQEII
ncbi:hypothetical protein FE257_010397 [Aspergillus nanangensis]|uniref:Uncharacterized protein n=1 Tax=Aspergillus nanangensis TaxID=2582783 RepID=A0AAD4CIN8_ASPNN|nr:hypothetical protein FE257_010397 [Aspergillus nanangensis]